MEISSVFYQIFPQLVVGFFATLSGISDGMQYGWTAPVLPILRSADSPVKITTEDETWLESVYLIGGVAGLPITIFLVDRIGRKKTILLASSLTLTSWVIIAVANRVEFLYVARAISGASADVAYVATPMYISEIASQKVRGFLVGLDYLMILLGVLAIYSIAPFTPYYVPSIVGALLNASQLIILPLLPASPYFLLCKGKREHARIALSRVRDKKHDIDSELEDIAKAIERQRSEEKGRPQDLFLVKSNRKAVTIITALVAAQHFSGFTVLVMNLHTILTEADSVYIKSEYTGIITSALMVVSAAVCISFVDRFGRRGLLTISSVLTGLCLLSIAVYFTLKYRGHDMESVSWIPVVAVMTFAVTFKIGLGFLPQILVSELFSSKIKAMGMALGDFLFIIFGFLSIVFYQEVAHSHGNDVPLYIFTCVSFLSAVFVIFVVPETKGKTLEEIQLMLKGEL